MTAAETRMIIPTDGAKSLKLVLLVVPKVGKTGKITHLCGTIHQLD